MGDSDYMITQHVAHNGGAPARLEIPQISEIFALFYQYLEQQPELTIEDLPQLPENSADFKQGIYCKDGNIILMKNIPKDSFKYVAMYCANLITKSEVLHNELFGLYVAVLVPCEDGKHYAPLAFSYLIKDDFFTTDNTQNIVPFQVLESAIPDGLSYMWVFLAMRYFHHHISDQVPYKYLADEQAEIERLKLAELYD